MQRDHISVPVHALSTATETARKLSNHAFLCHAALEHYGDGSAELGPITETLAECGEELRQLRVILDTIISSSGQFLLALDDQEQTGGAV